MNELQKKELAEIRLQLEERVSEGQRVSDKPRAEKTNLEHRLDGKVLPDTNVPQEKWKVSWTPN